MNFKLTTSEQRLYEPITWSLDDVKLSYSGLCKKVNLHDTYNTEVTML